MTYRGLIACANPRCFERLRFAIQLHGEETEHEQLAQQIGPLGWQWGAIECDDDQLVGFFCPRCSYAAAA